MSKITLTEITVVCSAAFLLVCPLVHQTHRLSVLLSKAAVGIFGFFYFFFAKCRWRSLFSRTKGQNSGSTHSSHFTSVRHPVTRTQTALRHWQEVFSLHLSAPDHVLGGRVLSVSSTYQVLRKRDPTQTVKFQLLIHFLNSAFIVVRQRILRATG